MRQRLARKNLLWVFGALVFIALTNRALEFREDFRQPGHWSSGSLILGSPLPSPQAGDGLQGLCGTYVFGCTGGCDLGSFIDTPAGHFRSYANQGIILIRSKQLSQGPIRLHEAMTRAEILDRLGSPTRRLQAEREVLVYDEGSELLAVVLKDGAVVNLESIRKFFCPVRGTSCAYYRGWWWDYLRTVSGETVTFDEAWPYFRRY